MEIKKFDVVKTLRDKGEIKKGSIGTIVEIWKDSELYEVEIVDESFKTIECLTLKPTDFTLLTATEIANLK